MPEDRFERAQVLQWLFFEQYSHEPNIAVARFWLLVSATPPGPSELDEKRRAGMPRSTRWSASCSDREFLVAERYTIADIALYAYTHVAHEGGFDLAATRRSRAWLERVAAQPGTCRSRPEPLSRQAARRARPTASRNARAVRNAPAARRRPPRASARSARA